MTAKISPRFAVRVEIDKKEILGDFSVVSEWEGMIKLESNCPVQRIIIRKPKTPGNPFDFVHSIFGGGQSPEKLKSIEAEVVFTDVDLR
jgi:hypothetical protein